MSHDELLPESAPPHEEAQGRDSAQGASSPDAPPAAPVRRRTRAAKPDAASVSPAAPAEKPARAPRRKKAAEEPAAPAVPEPAAPAAETPELAPSRPRRRKTTFAPDVPAPEITAAAEPPAEPTPAAPDTEPAPRRRTRRTKAEIAAAAASVSSPPASAATEVPEKAAETPAEPKKPSRRPSRRAVVEAETVIPPIPADVDVAIVAQPEFAVLPLASDASAAEAASAETLPETPAVPERPRRSRRRSRRPEETAALAESPAAAEAAAESTSAETPDTETGLTGRRGRNRRPLRNRRGAAAAETGETAEAVPAAPPVPREPEIDRTVGAHLIVRNGLPEIRINNVYHPPILFFGNVEEESGKQKVISETRRAAAAGVHLHSTLVELPCPLTESSDALDKFDARVRALLDADPDGFVMPRLVFVPARGWKREYPSDMAVYADGPASDPSLTSERFWQEAERSLAMLIAHVREHQWGQRVFGYHLERGEWFQSAEAGYDRSVANRDAFRDWLREKYGHELVGLRAAWYDGDVQFHTAEIPPVMTKPSPLRAFYETRRERRYIDFNEFTSESTAKRLTALAKAAKIAAGHQALVSVCYGYTFEFGHGFSGHLALETLLQSPHIDLVCGPPSYRDRKPGGAASFPAPVDSLILHKKLWLSEDDTKTYLAPAQQDPEDFNPRLGDIFATEQAQARAMGKALTQNAAVGWMDLWGEGWLDDESLWERIGAFTGRYGTALQRLNAPRTPEVVALIDEKSLLHLQRGEPFFRKITNGLRDVLQKAGVSYGTYLQSDLLEDDFPLGAKLYLFLTPYRLTLPQRAAILEKLQKDGKTLAFLYAPGSCEARPAVGGAMEEVAGGSVGILLRQQEWNSEIGSRVIEPHHPITERLPGREIGTRERINPSFFVDDPEATILAEYQGSGLPSIAARNMGTWKSVFVGEPTLPLELLRGICRYAGVHLWTQSDDVFAAGNGWIMLHSVRDGQRTLRLPYAMPLYDVTERRLIADDAREHRFFLRSGNTRLFYAGPREEMIVLGLPNADAPMERRRTETPSAPSFAAPEPHTPKTAAPEPPLEMEPEPERPSLRADLATLEAVLSLDVSVLDLEPDETEEKPPVPKARPLAAGVLPLSLLDDSDEANGRRRRRRGGRGRGRRRPGEEAEGETPAAGGAEPRQDAGQPLPAPETRTENEGF